jgi:hypothetical protein
MDLTTIFLALVLSIVALTTPFGLRFDGGGLDNMPMAERGRRVLFTVMSLVFGIGFVALAAAGAGAFLGLDGVAAMVPLVWLWGPFLLLSTVAAARRTVRGRRG